MLVQVVLLENHLQAFFLRMNEEFALVRRQQGLEAVIVRYHFTNQPFTNENLLNRLILPFNILNTYFNLFVFFSHNFTFYLVFASKRKMVRYRVIAPAHKRLATQDPSDSQQGPFQSKAFQGFEHVLRTAGIVTTDPNLSPRRNRSLIPPYHLA